MKLPRYFALAWSLLTLCYACELGAQEVIMDSSVAAVLDSLARDSVEHVVCLYGATKPGTVALLAYTMPRQQPIGTHNVSAAVEDCLAAIGHFHNHPIPKDSTAASYLYYSLTDEHSFIKSSQALIALVGVPGMVCGWTRQQVQEGLAMNLTPLPAIPAQSVRTP